MNFRHVLFMCLIIYQDVSCFLEDDPQTTDERLSELETEVVYLREVLQALQSCTRGYCEIFWSPWSAWSDWSRCTGQCSHGYNSRSQFRQRTRQCINDPGNLENVCTGSNMETDERPCNAVELYDCLNAANTNGSDVDYGLVYNFYDELAQSACVATITKPIHVAAVRRDCYSGAAESCADICSSLGYGCSDSLHVYKTVPRLSPNTGSHTDPGTQGLSMYRYFSCGGTGGCGPNYCCCQW